MCVLGKGKKTGKIWKNGKRISSFDGWIYLLGGCFIFKIMAGFCFFHGIFSCVFFFGSPVEPTVQAPWVGKEINNRWV